MKFFIEQIAIVPQDPARAIALLTELGLGEWARDHVVAEGRVYGQPGRNDADLAFNYQSTRGFPYVPDTDGPKPLELEVLRYTHGDNWMQRRPYSVSHLGMHCSAEELVEWRAKFAALGIPVAQEVMTESHTNEVIAGQRWYNYVIFDTRDILGVDLKFIVRLPACGIVREEPAPAVDNGAAAQPEAA